MKQLENYKKAIKSSNKNNLQAYFNLAHFI